MSWLTVRESIYALGVLSIFILLNGMSLLGFTSITSSIGHSGITLAHLLAGGWVYVLFAFYNKYI